MAKRNRFSLYFFGQRKFFFHRFDALRSSDVIVAELQLLQLILKLDLVPLKLKRTRQLSLNEFETNPDGSQFATTQLLNGMPITSLERKKCSFVIR